MYHVMCAMCILSLAGYGESFDNFLVSLRELAKTCKFCSDECIQKSIRDQIVEGLIDGDTVEDLLKESDLTLEATISKCRAQEAAKQQRAQQRPPTGTSPGCGSPHHQGGWQRCPAFNVTCIQCYLC